jgi:DpnII restriction endonuclease
MATRGQAGRLEALIDQVSELEELGRVAQGDDELAGTLAAKDLDTKYRKWYAASLEILSEDLHERFRREYEAGFPHYLIKFFLQDPRKESVVYRPDMDDASKKVWSQWQFPYTERFAGPIRTQRGILEQALARLGTGSATLDALELLENLGRRLPVAFSILGSPHRGKDGIVVADEYDVQHVLHAIAVLHFDEVEPEEPTPKMASGSSRLDFLLKQEEIAIETKMTRPNLSKQKLRDELASDIVYFRAHPSVKALFALIYDPNRRITNSVGVERDLNATSSDEFMVRVVVCS